MPMQKSTMNITILGIETSCDETGAAIYSTHNGLLSSALYSQVDEHKLFGGVLPEMASRTQLKKITPIVHKALADARMSLKDVDVIAVTNRPGLPGSLLVGVCFAKALAWSSNKKLIGVDHLEGHAFSAFLDNPSIPFPHLCITASGGHTALYLVRGFGDYTTLGHTLDDAAGEAFDKISKLLNIGYPGGPIIEKLAREVNFEDYFNYTRKNAKGLDFSFSGLKTAVLYDLVDRGAYDMQTKTLLDSSHELKQRVASSLLVCIADVFTKKVELALHDYPHVKALTFVGGVACNKYIKTQLATLCERRKIGFYTPSPIHCTDNAAMIAFVGAYKAQQGHCADLNLDIF